MVWLDILTSSLSWFDLKNPRINCDWYRHVILLPCVANDFNRSVI